MVIDAVMGTFVANRGWLQKFMDRNHFMIVVEQQYRKN